MSDKKLYLLAVSIGSAVGSWVPSLWGSGMFSGWSIVLGAVGGIAGLLAARSWVNS